MRRSAEAGGFTLVELVIVIAIIGILASIAIPRFIDIRNEAFNAQRDSTIGAVRAGILTTASQNQINGGPGAPFPPNLEATWNGIAGGAQPGGFAPPVMCITATPCFELVVPGGFVNSGVPPPPATFGWAQSGALTYTFDNPITGAGVDMTCTYTIANGTFTCV